MIEFLTLWFWFCKAIIWNFTSWSKHDYCSREIDEYWDVSTTFQRYVKDDEEDEEIFEWIKKWFKFKLLFKLHINMCKYEMIFNIDRIDFENRFSSLKYQSLAIQTEKFQNMLQLMK